jgi:cytochrome b561
MGLWGVKYSKIQIILHWFSAVIILWATISGFYVAFIDTPASVKATIGFFNVSITAVLIPFFIVRVYLAQTLSMKKPETFAQWVALIVHKIIYIVTIIVLVTGVLMMDRDINVFDVLLIPQPIRDPYWTSLFFDIHRCACMALAALLFLHLAAVVKHHLSGNPVLKRMSW